MVHANAQRLVLVLQQADQRFEGLGDALTDLRDLLGGEFGAVRIGLVEDEETRVDPDLVDMVRHFQGDLHPVVVDIRHQRHGLVGVFEAFADLAHRLGVGQGRHRDAHDFASRFMQAADPRGGPLDVEGVLIDHRLHHYGVLAADPEVADANTAGLATANDRVVTGGQLPRLGRCG